MYSLRRQKEGQLAMKKKEPFLSNSWEAVRLDRKESEEEDEDD